MAARIAARHARSAVSEVTQVVAACQRSASKLACRFKLRKLFKAGEEKLKERGRQDWVDWCGEVKVTLARWRRQLRKQRHERLWGRVRMIVDGYRQLLGRNARSTKNKKQTGILIPSSAVSVMEPTMLTIPLYFGLTWEQILMNMEVVVEDAECEGAVYSAIERDEGEKEEERAREEEEEGREVGGGGEQEEARADAGAGSQEEEKEEGKEEGKAEGASSAGAGDVPVQCLDAESSEDGGEDEEDGGVGMEQVLADNIEFTDRVRKWLSSADGRYRKMCIDRLVALAQGRRSYAYSKRLKGVVR